MPVKTELKLWYDKSAEKWTEALPLGNSETGSMIYGRTDRDIIALNNDRLWSGLPDEQQNTYAKDLIPAARKLIDEGKYAETHSLVTNRMLGHYTQSYMALGNLYLDFSHNPADVTDYARQLDLSKAEYSQTYIYNGLTYKREAILSYPDKVLAIRITASKPKSISFTASLDSQIRNTVNVIFPDIIELSGVAPLYNGPNYAPSDMPVIYDESENPKPIKFAARIKIITDGGKGHVSVIKKLLQEFAVGNAALGVPQCKEIAEIPIFGMVKDEFHKTRVLTDGEKEINIAKDQTVFILFYKIQEEVHRYSLKRMDTKRRKTVKTSALQGIKGLGNAKIKNLFERFKSINEIEKATADELVKVKGVTKTDAENIINYFNKIGEK